ncbi:thiamine pyrophosphokinase [Paenibacillus rhizosphaerae]|uniref:Thiamine diphosphokinase n=1 Tax=Paenibacillus rhizosphaerae TaxID=297318 RepID=A0A839TMS2_9BACL|nr:thiamine diphosphokinase [Paenibacillus rhizosphaerae]MBB3127911.1 thiamine pyrophosphokinase [Paenibacillus rhizosphaerae]
MEQKRVLIFSGGDLYKQYLKEIRPSDFLIGADRGALFLIENKYKPDLAVGDFDSISPDDLQKVRSVSKQLIDCDPIDKDLTDTELALDLAIKEQPDFILLMGVTGSRLDHTLSNIQMMNRVLQHHISCALLDRNNYMTLTGSSIEVQDRGYKYVSLLPMTPEVTGITLTGFQYPLDNATLKIGESLGISNQLTGSQGTISVEGGLLLVIQSND